jgi:hypothetical protein
MNFLQSIKSDLVERRLWPILALAIVAIAAIVILVGRSPSSSAPGAAASIPTVPAPIGPIVSVAPINPNQAASETTTGVRYQQQGGAHDPFVGLVAPETHKRSGKSKSSSSSATAASTTSSAPSVATPAPSPTTTTVKTSTSSTTTAAAPVVVTPKKPTPKAVNPTTAQVVKPTTPKVTKPTTSKSSSGSKTGSSKAHLATYEVSLRFGLVPQVAQAPQTGTSGPQTGASGPSTGTTLASQASAIEFKNIALTSLPNFSSPPHLEALPNPTSPLVSFLGVSSNGKTIGFAVLKSAIMRGPGPCYPDVVECQVLHLKAGQTETFDYVSASGLTRYELSVVSVKAHSVSSAAVATRENTRQSSAGHALMVKLAPGILAKLRISPQTGVLTSGLTP